MHFKQLELVGFKSFPHKTKINFEPGATAVVGPNGCGKSNISDAIRWVLGEQSPKSLRGSSMEDIIFSGTESIEPTNMAEVSLTLSNEDKALPIDYNEVTITRRLFRSGESEYALNKTQVRLKDVTNLLLGTGMGTTSYSIIEQGKIDMILSTKPEDRRTVFEEASGIIKYKSKKREALRKLEHTENNLLRINDIITEVKRQIGSIERQAKKAEKYKVDFEMMKDMELKLAEHELKSLNTELAKDREHLDGLKIEEASVKLEVEESIAVINSRREELDSIIQNITDLQKNLSGLSLFIETGRHKTELNGERTTDLEKFKKDAEEELLRLKEKIKKEKDEISNVRERLSAILKSKEENERALAEKSEASEKLACEINAHDKDIEDGKAKTLDLVSAQTKIKNELIKLGADLANRKARLGRLEVDRENIRKEKENVDALLKKVDSEIEIYKSCMAEKQLSLKDLRNRLDSAERLVENLKKRIAENVNESNSLKSKEEITREMIENFEGFDKGVKLIMESKKKNSVSGVLGVVADILEAETGYELALESALGKKAEAIVVENGEALKASLKLLEAGRSFAHFIIKEDIEEPRDINAGSGVSNETGVRRLLSFVRTDPSYKAVAEKLLGNVYVAENADIAYETSRNLKGDSRLVTKDGFLVEKGYLLGGVMNDRTTVSIIGREKRLREIIKEKERLFTYAKALESELGGEINILEGLKTGMQTGENDLKKEEIELANILSRKGAIEDNRKKIVDDMSVVELEIDEMEDLVHDISVKGEGLNKALNENEKEYVMLERFVADSRKSLKEKTIEKNNLIFAMSDIKSGIDFSRSREEGEVKTLERETALLDELFAQYEGKKNDVSSAAGKIAALLSETKNLEEAISAKEEERKKGEEEFNEVSESKISILQKLRERETEEREKENSLEALRGSISAIEMKNRENELKIGNIKERIREVYKVNIEEVLLETAEGTNWEEIRNQIDVLKIKLEKLGPVNLVAIDEHKELEERFTFLTQQEEDLLSAKDSLHKAIVKINKTTRELFIETFEKIQVEFRNYFRLLFGGGHAELLLLDENDVLECGIEIVARPPGKKLQNLLLLSGGEKALAAISLLFAMFKVKPSPFCILDEVDAPLDESNIGKFTRVLQEFLKLSQFIIITHNKRTMEMANVLYGITMEDKGVSKIVSVKFSEDKKENVSEKEEVLV